MLSKKEFLDLVAVRLNKSRKEIGETCEILIDVMLETVKKDEKFKFLDLGTFILATRQARTGINPATKERVEIPEKKVLKFKPSKNTVRYFSE